MSRVFLEDLRRGMQVDETFLKESVNLKQTRNGSHFLQITLRDKTASVRALRWEASMDEYRRVDRNPFLRVNGRVEEYQGNLQVIIDELHPLSADDAHVRPEEFLPRTEYDIDEMASELRGIVDEIENGDVRRLVDAVLARPNIWDRLLRAPAGKAMHHAYIGGLLEHKLSLARLARRILPHYNWLDPSLLVAGVVLHDLGKTQELDYTTGFNYTDSGQLVGHIVMAAQWVREEADRLGDIDPEVAMELEHIILAHHGKLEFGSPKLPMTAEALALHFLDNLDAKLAGFAELYKSTRPEYDGNRWSEWSMMMGTKVYFGRRLDTALGGRRGTESETATGSDGDTPSLPF